MEFLDLDLNRPETPLKFIDRLATTGAMEIGSYAGETLQTGLPIARIPPLTALYLEFG